MNPYLMSQDEAKLIKPVIIKYNHTDVKYAIRRVWSVKGKHNVRHMARLVGKGLRHIWKPGLNGHFGTSKVSLRKEVPFIERSIYTQLL